MKVFLSWSGPASKQIASALRTWLPLVIQAVEPWMSAEDIDKGTRWGDVIAKELDKTQVGVICLTPDNLASPWLHFEAGALAKTIDTARVCTYLFDVKHADVRFPLASFQHTLAEKEDTRKLVRTINTALGERRLAEERLDASFSAFWPQLKENLRRVEVPQPATVARTDRSILEEILELVRHGQKPQELEPLEWLIMNSRGPLTAEAVGMLTAAFRTCLRNRGVAIGGGDSCAQASLFRPDAPPTQPPTK